jgi:hypothetical protein
MLSYSAMNIKPSHSGYEMTLINGILGNMFPRSYYLNKVYPGLNTFTPRGWMFKFLTTFLYSDDVGHTCIHADRFPLAATP